MKFLTLIFWSIFVMALSSSAYAKTFTITINGIETERPGSVMVMIFGADGYPISHEKALYVQTKKASQKVLKFQFTTELEELAIKVLHDEDESGKTTKNWTGILPAEGLGFSNGQKLGLTGPPSYRKSKLTKAEYTKGVSITIRYP